MSKFSALSKASSNKLRDLVHVSERLTASSRPNQPELEKYYQEYGYQYLNDDIVISKHSDKDQIACPQCTYQYKRYQIREIPIEPYSRPCPVCHFKFSIFKEANFQITKYYKMAKETPPKKLYDFILYQEIYKKLYIIMYCIIFLLI